MTSEQAMALFDLGSAAVDNLIVKLLRDKERLIRLAIDRASTLGGEYEDASYNKSDDLLGTESDEELADAIFYEHVRLL